MTEEVAHSNAVAETNHGCNHVTKKRRRARNPNLPPEAARDQPYWVVRRMHWGGNPHHGPMFRHATEDQAIEEAVRLAKKFPGSQFTVLKAVGIIIQDGQVNKQTYHV